MATKVSLFKRLSILLATLCGAIGILAFYLVSLSEASVASEIPNYKIFQANNLADERWRIFADMNKMRGDPGVVALNGKIHVLGGYFPSFFGYNQTQEVYDPQADSWQFRANLPTGMSDMMVAVVGDQIYSMGGWNLDLGGAISYTYKYDPIADSWITMTSIITPVSGAGVAVITDTIYIIGGFDNSNGLNIVQIYKPALDTWSVGTPMSIGRSELGAVELDGKIYAIGGVSTGGIPTNTVEIYDPASGLWTMGPPLPERRASMAASARQGNIYIVGGIDDSVNRVAKNTVFVFDPLAGIWSTVNPVPTARYANKSAVISDTLYVIGGVGEPGAPTANEGFGFPPVTSTITISSDEPDPSQFNQPFTVSYIVTATGEIPTGVVTVTVDKGAEHCSGLLNNGSGSCQLVLNTLGTVPMTATYSGNYILLGSNDSEQHDVVKADTFTTILSSDPNPSLLGIPMTVTFNVTSSFGQPTGAVTVTVGDNNTTCLGILAGGFGNCSLTLPTIGVFTITAAYNGDATFNPSSDSITHIVEPYQLFLPVLAR